jgi:hypothetical protein
VQIPATLGRCDPVSVSHWQVRGRMRPSPGKANDRENQDQNAYGFVQAIERTHFEIGDQQPGGQPAGQPGGQPPATQPAFLPEVVVTATGYPEPVNNIYSTVQVITQDRIAHSTAKSVTELLADGTLTVIHQDGPDKYHVVENVQTAMGARNMGLDPSTHRLFVVAATLGPAPTNSRQPAPIVPGSFMMIVIERTR